MFGIVKRLCDMGANVNAKNKYGYNAMVYAALNRNPKMIQYLIDKGLNVKKCYAGPNNDPILRLMFTGEFYYPYYNQKKTFDLPHFDQADYETFELLIKHGANVTDINSDKDTLMHLAVLSTNWLIHNANLYFFKMIFKLDPAGSKKSLTMRNKNGLTPLDIAKRDYVSDAIRTYLNEQAGLTKLDPYN